MTQSDQAYLLALTGHSSPLGQPPEDAGIDASLKLAVRSIGTSPAMIVNPRFDIVESNRLAGAVFESGDYTGPFAQNMFWRAYMDPVRRSLYLDWNERLMNSLGLLRANYASRVGDPHFEELLQALRQASPQFAGMWDTCHAEPLTPAPIRLASRRLGRLHVWSTRFAIPERPGFLMLVYVPANSATSDRFAKEAAHLRRQR